MQFEFATATRIIFGEGTVEQVAPAALQWGSRILLVTGQSLERTDELRAQFTAARARCFTFTVKGEPTVDAVNEGLQQAREGQCDVVIAFGGGAAIDAGKAIAGLLTNGGEAIDYLEVVGKGNALKNPAAPFIAVPTTAGTGSEVTRNAVLGVPDRKVKVSLRSPLLLPRLAVVDPELTLNLPSAITARTGLDALTQLMEAYVSVRANPLTDGLCVRGIPLGARVLRRAFHHGREIEPRHDMSLAAMLSGMALANAGLGAVHGFAAPIGGRFPAPHGAICAAILPHAMEINLRALRSRDPQSIAIRRYQEIGRMLTGRPGATAEDGICWVKDTCQDFGILPLKSYGIGPQDVPTLIAEAAKASSMKGNPLPLPPEELAEMLTLSMNGG
jgi:alcohol dehydrogenase class IV